MRLHKDADPRVRYWIPEYAVVGGSDCGNDPDSPARTDDLIEELSWFARDMKAETGIRGVLSRPLCTNNKRTKKRWVVVAKPDYAAAIKYADEWLRANRVDTYIIHDVVRDK